MEFHIKPKTVPSGTLPSIPTAQQVSLEQFPPILCRLARGSSPLDVIHGYMCHLSILLSRLKIFRCHIYKIKDG